MGDYKKISSLGLRVQSGDGASRELGEKEKLDGFPLGFVNGSPVGYAKRGDSEIADERI